MIDGSSPVSHYLPAAEEFNSRTDVTTWACPAREAASRVCAGGLTIQTILVPSPVVELNSQGY